MRKYIVVVLLLLMVGHAQMLWAQLQPQAMQTRMLVDMPTAGLLDRGSFSVGIRAYPGGGLLGEISVGLTSRLNFGASFGGENIIGTGEVLWNPNPGVHFAYRFFEESYTMPALVMGFHSQGYGSFYEDFDRYDNKSRGFYAVASKYYVIPLNLGIHFGVNYSLEKNDGDEDVDAFAGADIVLNEEFVIVADYDFALNDDDADAFGDGKGYLNAGIRWVFAQRLFVEFSFRNILQNRDDFKEANRELKIVYLEYF